MYKLADTYKNRDEIYKEKLFISSHYDNLYDKKVFTNREELSNVEIFGKEFDFKSDGIYTKELCLEDLHDALSNLWQAVLSFKFIELEADDGSGWLFGRVDTAKHIAKKMLGQLLPLIKEYTKVLHEIDVAIEYQEEHNEDCMY